jgi:hypothetical protein
LIKYTLFEGSASFGFCRRDVDPYETVTHKLTLAASKSGVREIIVTFDSKELRDVSGVQEICVEE